MSHAFTPFKAKLLKGDVDFDEAGNDLRVLLVLTGSNAASDPDLEFVSAITNEAAAGGYVRKALATQAVATDLANNRGEFSADAVVWTGLTITGAIGFVIFRFVTNDADSPVIAYIDSGGFPVTLGGAGGTLTITPNAEGLLQAT